MSKLREEIERRRAARNAHADVGGSADATAPARAGETGAVAAPPASAPSCLRITKTNGQCWLLPWTCFHGASHDPDGSSADGNAGRGERLRLAFLRHEVILHGRELVGLVDAIEAARLRKLDEIAEKFRAATGDGPVIVQIEVKAG
ncbi:hypothetical protein OH491_05100 [Termitidicoccus mucosus]|uniref:Uncharacterized protein n=1 Tax=Termitidicoccus mucosus TaxID=1184151 RepID=A0A178IML3_9BACT|nr:hypothetical protein AW736_04490 [Opitutaceae bacterium TSB47]